MGVGGSAFGQITCTTLTSQGVSPDSVAFDSDFAAPLQADTVISFRYDDNLIADTLTVGELVELGDSLVAEFAPQLSGLLLDLVDGLDEDVAAIVDVVLQLLGGEQGIQDIIDGLINDLGLNDFQTFLGIDNNDLDSLISFQIVFDSLLFTESSVELDVNGPGNYGATLVNSSNGALPTAYTANPALPGGDAQEGCVTVRFTADSAGAGDFALIPKFRGEVLLTQFPAGVNQSLDSLLGVTLPVGTPIRFDELLDVLLVAPLDLNIPIPATLDTLIVALAPLLAGFLPGVDLTQLDTIALTLDWPNQTLDVSTLNPTLDSALFGLLDDLAGITLPLDISEFDINGIILDLLEVSSSAMDGKVTFGDGTLSRAGALVSQLNAKLYPNPIQGTTVLAYNLPQAATVALQVVNATGQTVFERPVQQQAAGNQSVALGALEALPAGIYLLRLTVDGAPLTQNILVP